jgi:hypothetical protein
VSATSDDVKSNHSSIPRWQIGSACSYISPGGGGASTGNIGATLPVTSSGLAKHILPS